MSVCLLTSGGPGVLSPHDAEREALAFGAQHAAALEPRRNTAANAHAVVANATTVVVINIIVVATVT